jgi:hypothetical protein
VAQPISFRPTPDDERNLALLVSRGLTRTEAIRLALETTARQQRRSRALAAEAKLLAADPIDRAAVAEVREFLGDTWDRLE